MTHKAKIVSRDPSTYIYILAWRRHFVRLKYASKVWPEGEIDFPKVESAARCRLSLGAARSRRERENRALAKYIRICKSL